MPDQVRLPDGTTVTINSPADGPDRTPSGTWLAECVCSGAPGRPDRVDVTYDLPSPGTRAPVSVTVTWNVAPERPPSAQDAPPGPPPGVVVPTQRPGAAPPPLP
ncbi:hypothetical protein [Cryptosporangium phraense]|uniref:Uncharacterized protein n=1 Tax=Cryptosporangium phraense TaxID=2593070 RepID=A0A545AT34_9ACTN|nr:hypothetical protein [Cryptosporangium phraense]TQS44499.1 hypothetical protein FL583_13630 [Cryptosporangium phraense]